MSTTSGAGKGDTTRPRFISDEQWARNYARTFRGGGQVRQFLIDLGRELLKDGASMFLLCLMVLMLWVGWCAPEPEPAVAVLDPIHEPSFQEIIEHIEQERLDSIAVLRERYQLTDTLAILIHDIALAEGIDPDLGARLVAVESGFKANAVSWAGAVGYTQVLPSTAREIMPDLTYSEMFDPATNLHLGFRYLNSLLDEYDLEHALLAYNRGPNRVRRLLAMGYDPRNGYAESVCRGPCPIQ